MKLVIYMRFIDLKSLILKDFQRCKSFGAGGGILVNAIFNARFCSLFCFRILSYLRSKKGVIYKILFQIFKMWYLFCQRTSGIQIGLGADIGGGLGFTHYSCIVIHPQTKIGENCTILQGVTIGRNDFDVSGVPTIGNHVIIYAGAKIFGNIRIGNNVVIGANAVVSKDIPDNCIVAGVPAKILYKGDVRFRFSADKQKFFGWE